MKKCSETNKNKVFTFSEKRSHLTLNNLDQVKSTKSMVDGCLINDGLRCDYKHEAKGIEFYIELKGQDLEHAIEQIKCTIKLLSKNVSKGIKKCYIICTRSPMSSSEILVYKKKFKTS